MNIGEFIAEKIHNGELKVCRLDAFVQTVLRISRQKAVRLIEGGGVDVNEKQIRDRGWILVEGDDVRIGKGRFCKVLL